MEDFKLDKIGCNHLILTGLLESPTYAKADFLAMNLEQHLNFTIDRQGKLKSQWDDHYKKVLVPLEITSPEIEKGETVVYTREGRLIGGFDEFKLWAKLKYNIDIDYDDARMEEISKVHVNRAETQIADNNTEEFDKKVDALLKDREERLNKMNKVLETHQMVCQTVQNAIDDLGNYAKVIQPHLDVLYALHKYPVKEVHEEEEEQSSEVPDEEKENENDGEEGENENENEDGAENAEAEVADDVQNNGENETQENDQEDGENPEKDENQNEEEEKVEKPVEEEEEGEPDPEALEAQAKMQETLKFPPLDLCKEAMEKLKDADVGIQDFIDQIKAKEKECSDLIKDEKFRWKKLEAEMLDLKEKLSITQNMLKITILSAEDLQIKAVQNEIDNYENFLIPNADKEVLDAAAIKFAATFDFA